MRLRIAGISAAAIARRSAGGSASTAAPPKASPRPLAPSQAEALLIIASVVS
jgi:hypothetical protein